MKRRDFIKFSTLSVGAMGLSFYSNPLLSMTGESKKKIVVIFLKGGADVLSLFPPNKMLNQPGSKILFRPEVNNKISIKNTSVRLHSVFDPLATVINPNNLSIITHTGSLKNSVRSHFEQISQMEKGSPELLGGYLARVTKNNVGMTVRDAVAIGESVPSSLAGADVPLLSELADLDKGFKASILNTSRSERLGLLKNAKTESFVSKTATSAQNNYDSLAEGYGTSDIGSGSGFKKACITAAQLTQKSGDKGGFEPSIITIDFGAWDDHINLDPNAASGFTTRASDLSQGLTALYSNMSEDTVVVVMTEFGRTIRLNNNNGTDHGEGSAMLVMGKGMNELFSNAKFRHEWDFTKLSRDSSGSISSEAFATITDWKQVMSVVLKQQFKITQGIF